MKAKSTTPADFKQVILLPLTYPLIAVALMWAVHLISVEFSLNLSHYGLKPRDLKGLLGILTMPFLHGSFEHLSNNSMPMLVLGWALFKFYPTIAWRSVLSIWIISGIWLWISGRDSYHIGASGLVYGLATFLFLSGWLRKEKGVAALSLVIVFVYGSLWWGILPVDPRMSWEGHLWGALAGFAMAYYLRKRGPQRPLYQWEIDEIEEAKRALELESVMESIEYEVVSDSNVHEENTGYKSALNQNTHIANGDSARPDLRIKYDYKPTDQGKKDKET